MSATIPIIFLTARDSDFDTVSGLRMGADDYLTKDISLPHLLARIAALFRRTDIAQAPGSAEDVFERGKLRVDLTRMRVNWNEAPVELTVTELWIVHALARHPGHVKHRDQLMRDARMVVDDTTVTSHVKRIRRKFMDADPAFDCIETVYGMGYRWKSE
jgi:two-component system OmpR family response regulator